MLLFFNAEIMLTRTPVTKSGLPACTVDRTEDRDTSGPFLSGRGGRKEKSSDARENTLSNSFPPKRYAANEKT